VPTRSIRYDADRRSIVRRRSFPNRVQLGRPGWSGRLAGWLAAGERAGGWVGGREVVWNCLIVRVRRLPSCHHRDVFVVTLNEEHQQRRVCARIINIQAAVRPTPRGQLKCNVAEQDSTHLERSTIPVRHPFIYRTPCQLIASFNVCQMQRDYRQIIAQLESLYN